MTGVAQGAALPFFVVSNPEAPRAVRAVVSGETLLASDPGPGRGNARAPLRVIPPVTRHASSSRSARRFEYITCREAYPKTHAEILRQRDATFVGIAIVANETQGPAASHRRIAIRMALLDAHAPGCAIVQPEGRTDGTGVADGDRRRFLNAVSGYRTVEDHRAL
jgi:hypothetical protein